MEVCVLPLPSSSLRSTLSPFSSLQPVPCPYAAVGCSTPLVQCEVDQHCADCMEAHLRQAVSQLLDLKINQRLADSKVDLMDKVGDVRACVRVWVSE